MNCSNNTLGTGHLSCAKNINQIVSYQLNLDDFDKNTRKHLRLLIKQFDVHTMNIDGRKHTIYYNDKVNQKLRFELTFYKV